MALMLLSGASSSTSMLLMMAGPCTAARALQRRGARERSCVNRAHVAFQAGVCSHGPRNVRDAAGGPPVEEGKVGAHVRHRGEDTGGGARGRASPAPTVRARTDRPARGARVRRSAGRSGLSAPRTRVPQRASVRVSLSSHFAALSLSFSASLLLSFSASRSLARSALSRALWSTFFFFFRVQKKHGREHVAGSDPRRRGSGEHPAYTIGNVQRVCTQAFHDAGLATGLPTRSGEGRRSD